MKFPINGAINMEIQDLPEFKNKSQPFTLDGDDSVTKAIEVMADRDIGSVVIIDRNQSVKGIVTERDLLRRLLGRRLDPDKTTLSAIMTKDPLVASLSDDHADWLRVMSNKRFRHLPVVDDKGKLINLMSLGDFISHSWPEILLMLKDKTKDSLIGPAAQIPILFFGLIIYSLILYAITKYI